MADCIRQAELSARDQDSTMRIPTASYRIQFNASFTFKDARDLVEYLAQLGISHIYASPIFKARRGSTHGYDIVDPNGLNPEIGSQEEFYHLTDHLRSHGMYLMADIVPNHMAYDIANYMLADILRYGVRSKFIDFFDVDWEHPSDLRGRLLAPFLGKHYWEALRDGELELIYDGELKIKYFDLELPLNIESYSKLLGLETGPTGKVAERDTLSLESVRKLWEESEHVRSTISKAVAFYNSDKGSLDGLLSSQNFKLSYWNASCEEINYRRFFNISDLICLKGEVGETFEETHRLVLGLITDGRVSGLRIDHVDGLSDPELYLRRLRERAQDVYIVVEKILTRSEGLPSFWPIQGTTGYDFLSWVNGVFVSKHSEVVFNNIYSEFTGRREPFEDLLYRCKKLIVSRHFAGDVDNLARLFHKVINIRVQGRDYTLPRIRAAIVELLATFPVYRTYLSESRRAESCIQVFKKTLSNAKLRNPAAAYELEAIEGLLDEGSSSKDALRCFTRLQQFTGQVMAKGLEDTALYVFNKLISLNEVGCDPDVFGISIADFHEFNKKRQAGWRYSMNSTSTHDTKRGEDVRARINILSEIPSQWGSKIKRWAEFNAGYKRQIAGKLAPDRNEEYYIYQTLIGAFPFEINELQEFTERVKTHMVKAVREAKVNSSWLEPNAEYEEAVTSFLEYILKPSDHNIFLQEFIPVQKEIAYYGVFNSLSQTLLKITCPGVPDFYQGSELWDLSLVDPDNRRPVDFQKRRRFLEEILKIKSAQELEDLLNTFEDGRIKLYVIYTSLKFRKDKKTLFEEGAYIPLTVEGRYKEHIIAFCRKMGEDWAMIVVPRHLARLIRFREWPFGKEIWKDTRIRVFDAAPSCWKDVFTGKDIRTISTHDNTLQIGDVLSNFPVALLIGG